MLSHPRDEAVVVARTLGSETRFGGRRHLAPEREVLGQIFELGTIAGFRALRPVADDRQEDVVSRRAGPAGELIELVQAQIVRAALHARSGEGNAQRFTQSGNVLEENLLLKVLGARGDEDALAAQDRRNEIGERLPGAGARFGEEDAALVEHVRDGRRHLELPGARLETGHGASQRAAGRKDRSDGLHPGGDPRRPRGRRGLRSYSGYSGNFRHNPSTSTRIIPSA